ncbi:hypothetical protein ACJMK2_004664 [Sinanodonta woodiana]|uniref:Coiled-coil domain-containing protein 43 n=1 Tax=Sinanodonta woodiana TaxID=1069815 RepID=A0ABD3Y1W1_SINWO
MAASMEPYDKWLRDKLLSLNQDIDMDVFGPYISGILEEDSSFEDKKDSLLGILEQVVESGHDSLCDEILKQWDRIHGLQSNQLDETSHDKVSDLAEMLENHKIEIVKPREASKEMSEAKAAILAQYGTVSSDDEEDDDSNDGGGGAGPAGGGSAVDKNDPLSFKNRNVESVLQSEKEMKEKAKAETDKRKEKDKQDRDAQKQKQNERKDTEKKRTQKGERKR